MVTTHRLAVTILPKQRTFIVIEVEELAVITKVNIPADSKFNNFLLNSRIENRYIFIIERGPQSFIFVQIQNVTHTVLKMQEIYFVAGNPDPLYSE
jgi:hypothetical protein